MRFLAFAMLIVSSSPALAADLVGIPRIVDGDTVEIAGTKIRLQGIDAPETDQLCLDAKGERWACGIEARNRLEAYAGGKEWTCAISGQDKYGRSLGACRTGEGDIEAWMARSGWAMSFTRYSHRYDADEAAARGTKVGLWAGSFIAPWDWRGRNVKTIVLGAAAVPIDARKVLLGSASASEAPDPHCTIKGNVNRSGECIFHVEGGKFYAKVKMDPRKGKRWFCSEVEAEAAGCRKSKL